MKPACCDGSTVLLKVWIAAFGTIPQGGYEVRQLKSGDDAQDFGIFLMATAVLMKPACSFCGGICPLYSLTAQLAFRRHRPEELESP